MIFFRFAAESPPPQSALQTAPLKGSQSALCVWDSSPRGELSPQVTEGWFHIQNPKQLPGPAFAPAGAFRRPTRPQVRLLGRRWPPLPCCKSMVRRSFQMSNVFPGRRGHSLPMIFGLSYIMKCAIRYAGPAAGAGGAALLTAQRLCTTWWTRFRRGAGRQRRGGPPRSEVRFPRRAGCATAQCR